MRKKSIVVGAAAAVFLSLVVAGPVHASTDTRAVGTSSLSITEPAPSTDVETPVVPPAEPVLADTGADFAPMGIVAGALLLGGIIVTGAVDAVRRIRGTRP
jgi:hypothetical protein